MSVEYPVSVCRTTRERTSSVKILIMEDCASQCDVCVCVRHLSVISRHYMFVHPTQTTHTTSTVFTSHATGWEGREGRREEREGRMKGGGRK